jgi:hypothetical protein
VAVAVVSTVIGTVATVVGVLETVVDPEVGLVVVCAGVTDVLTEPTTPPELPATVTVWASVTVRVEIAVTVCAGRGALVAACTIFRRPPTTMTIATADPDPHLTGVPWRPNWYGCTSRAIVPLPLMKVPPWVVV